MNYFTGVLSKTSTDQEIATDLTQKWHLWYGEMAGMRSKADDYEQYYNGKALPISSSAHPDTPNYFVPYIETLVDVITAKFFLTMFAHNPIIRYKPISKDSILATRITERIMHYYLNHRTPDVMTNLYICVVDAVLQGYGMLFMYWDKCAMAHTTVEPTVSDPMLEEIQEDLGGGQAAPETPDEELTKNVTTESIQYEGFQFQPLDIRDVATDVNEVNYRKVPVVVREFINPETYFERMESMDYPTLTEEVLESAIVPGDGSRMTDTGRGGTSWRSDSSSSSARPKLEILHYYGKGYASTGADEKLQDVKISILLHANEQLGVVPVLERAAIGFKPIVILRMKPAKQVFGGRGVGDQCYDLQTELNINYNARILNTSMALHRMYIVSDDAEVDSKKLISRPGGIIPVKGDINGIRELNHTPLTPDAFAFVKETISYMQSVTAAQDIVMGQAQRQELATTATILDNNSKQRLELHIYRMLKEFVPTLGDNARMMLLKAFDPEDKVMAILSKDEIAEYGPQLTLKGQNLVDENGMLEVQVKDLQGAMYADIEVSAADGDDRAVRQETLQLLQTTLQLNPQGMATGEMTEDKKQVVMEKVNVTKVIKELFRLQGRTDVSEFISRILVPNPQLQAPQQQPPKTSVGVAIKFENLAPAVQARVLMDAQLIKESDEAEVTQEQSSGRTPATPAGQGDAAGVPGGAPPEEEMQSMVAAADQSAASGE